MRVGRSVRPRTTVLILALLLVGGCASSASSSDPYEETAERTYQADFTELVNTVGEVLVEIGLGVEDAGAEDASTYLITASRTERAFGGTAIPVATVYVYVKQNAGGTTSVRVETEKVSRTSMQGQSSSHRTNYARELFEELDEQFASTVAPAS